MAELKLENYRQFRFRSGKRDRLEIVSAIIAVTQQPSTVTHLIGYANLSYSILKEYLRFMISKRLIEKRDLPRGDKRTISAYEATEKGNRFLELYCESLILLHGDSFLENNSSLADAYLLQYCRKNKLTLNMKLSRSDNKNIGKQKGVLADESANRVHKSP